MWFYHPYNKGQQREKSNLSIPRTLTQQIMAGQPTPPNVPPQK